MASITPSNGKTVLITGLSGFIASVLGKLLLTKGYHIRGTTRRASSVQPIIDGAYAEYKDRVTIFEISDITKDGVFDEAVKGVHGIFHTASPVVFALDKYEDVIDPALHGTTSILESALKHAGPQLTSVVVTSSVAALIKIPLAPGAVCSEETRVVVDLEALKQTLAKGEKVPLYAPSKQAACDAVWKFREEKRPPFAISQVHPSVVIGPPAQLVDKPEKLNETLKFPFTILSGQLTSPTFGSGNFVDVRDVALVHLLAYENPSIADGQGYVASGGYGPNQAVVDIMREMYPDRTFHDEPGRGPGKGYIGFNEKTGKVEKVEKLPETPWMDATKAEKTFGIEWIDFVTSTKETAKALEPLL